MKPQRTIRPDLLRWLACLWLLAGWADAAEYNADVSEYQGKADFLCNFTQFTDWPRSAFLAINAPMVIGIVGEDPFGKTLDDAVRGKVVRGRPLVVKRVRTEEDLRSCHVLFISRSEQARLPAVFSQLKGSPVLTVSDLSGFAQEGGMVNLLLVNKTVKMEINPAAAKESGLQISSKLLKLARIVKSQRNGT